MTLAPDQIAELRRPFDSAWRRICLAATESAGADEVSNALHHFYRLCEARKNEVGSISFFAEIAVGTDHERIAAVRWCRNADTHQFVTSHYLSDVVSDYVTELVGVLVWVTEPPSFKSSHSENVAFARTLAGKPVLDSLKDAMDELAAICGD